MACRGVTERPLTLVPQKYWSSSENIEPRSLHCSAMTTLQLRLALLVGISRHLPHPALQGVAVKIGDPHAFFPFPN
ncbi:hypothetical protein VTH06DRAFT_246 [Thermothelomyces fergusii]